jgi:DinB superfamily
VTTGVVTERAVPPNSAKEASRRESIRLGLGATRADWHRLLAGLSGDDWGRPSLNPGWTNGEVLFHMTLGFMILAALVPLVRLFGRLPLWASRIYASILDLGTPVFNWVNALGARGGGRLHNQASIGKRFDRAQARLLGLVNHLPDGEWSRRMHFPRRWDPLFDEVMTVERAFRYMIAHFNFHLGQIARRGVGAGDSPDKRTSG